MYVCATKTHGEREDEETARLIRPAPKHKPPRRDRRRERTDADTDPDLKADIGVDGDPDMSLNYKLAALRVLARYVLSRSPTKLVPAWSRREKLRVMVSPETLKTDRDYEPYRGQDKKYDSDRRKKQEEPESEQEELESEQEEPESEQEELEPEDVAREIADVAEQELGPSDIQPEESSSSRPSSDMPGLSPEAHLNMLGARDDRAREALMDIADPSTVLGKKILELSKTYNLADLSPDDTIPALAGKLPKSMTMKDVVEAAKEMYPPRELTKQERREATRLYFELPPNVRDLIPDFTVLHPDEIRAIAEAHEQISRRPPTKAKLKEMVNIVRETGYHTDPRTIHAPRVGKDANGKIVPFAELDDVHKAKAWADHRATVLARCVAARAAMTDNLVKAGLPVPVADLVVSFRLDPKGKDVQSLTDKAFDQTLSNGTILTNSQRVGILDELADDPDAQRIAVGIMQAADYEEARRKYLGARSPEAVSEHAPASAIARAITRAMADLDETRSQYPSGSAQRDIATVFRDRVLRRLKTLNPRKYQATLKEVQKADALRYKQLQKQHKKDMKHYEKAHKLYEKAKARAEAEYKRAMKKWEAEAQRLLNENEEKPYRSPVVDLPPAPVLRLPPEPIKPPEPVKPVSLTPEEAADLHRKLFQPPERTLSMYRRPVRFASRSSYAPSKVMKRAVYHGVDPYPVMMKPYPGWAQAHQRDFSALDHAQLVLAAQKWLRSHFLKYHYDGAPRDVQLRAALDLAIRTTNSGAYSSGVSPTLYEALLRDLADIGPDGTLLTIREAGSSYSMSGTIDGDKTMTMPKFAAEQANGLLTRLDRLAHTIQTRYAEWGMPFKTAKEIVNDLDRTADEIEVAAFGMGSFRKRQAEVIMRNPDEPYMSTFENPMQPLQVDADEPYMRAYRDDQSSAIAHGVAGNGRPLAP
jgi:hypothetical protein